jgi:hypothetical protein
MGAPITHVEINSKQQKSLIDFYYASSRAQRR